MIKSDGAYYNENDPYCADWLRSLIREGLIADGEVDTRDVRDVVPGDLVGFAQVHLFAGLGGWSRALRISGWPDSEEVWTGSCPCQPFSAAGRKGRFTDKRHLWPAFFHLVRQCRPPVIFGEQVASPAGIAWLDLVSDDLEGEGFAAGAIVLPACGVGAPHIRQRIWFTAYRLTRGLAHGVSLTGGERRERVDPHLRARKKRPCDAEADGVAESGRKPAWRRYPGPGEDPSPSEERESDEPDFRSGSKSSRPASSSGVPGTRTHTHTTYGVGDTRLDRAREHVGELQSDEEEYDFRTQDGDNTSELTGAASTATRGFWKDVEWLPCLDGKYRPAKPGIFPLAHGVPARVGKLRAAGNAIVPQVAAEMIRTYNDWVAKR